MVAKVPFSNTDKKIRFVNLSFAIDVFHNMT